MLLALIQVLHVDVRGWNADGKNLAIEMNQELIQLEESIDPTTQTLEIIDIHYVGTIPSQAFITYRIDEVTLFR